MGHTREKIAVRPEIVKSQNPLLRRLFRILLKITCVIAVFLCAYATCWYFQYRQPAKESIVLDRHNGTSNTHGYVTICAALADNPHGFPGHCYVVWSRKSQPDFKNDLSLSFMPKRFEDQPAALVMEVPGVVWPNSARGNMRYLNTITVAVDEKVFQSSREKAIKWAPERFQAGKRDCVAFAQAIAREIGLDTPDCTKTYPQDYLRKLQSINREPQYDSLQ